MNAFRNPSQPGARLRRGFTLIELMIVVAVIGVLAIIAVPAYNEQVRKTRRAQARSDTMALVQALERFHTANNTYNGYPPAAVNSPADGTAFYTITPSDLTATTYTLTATPVPGSDQANDRCGELTINHAGVKTSELLTPAECW